MAKAQEFETLLSSFNEEQKRAIMERLGKYAAASATAGAGGAAPSKPETGILKKAGREKWFDKPACGLTEEGLKLLSELEKQLDDPRSSYSVDKKQVRYLRTLKKMKVSVPPFFRENIEPKKLYRRLRSFCVKNDIPEEIVRRVVPSLITYIETGSMRPIIFVGEKGCGKTTAVRMLVEEALKLHTEVIKIPQLEGGHGITGDCGVYKSADVGCIAKARFKCKSLVFALVFDEIDKVAAESNRANIDDQLLSVTDSSNSDITDNYLETSIVYLEHVPMFFTANDLSKVNPILADRCTVINFPSADVTRIKSIARKYVAKEMENSVYSLIRFDYELLNKSIENLVNHNITSLRKHQQLIEFVLQDALNAAFEQESDNPVTVTDKMFSKAEDAVIRSEKRKIRFN